MRLFRCRVCGEGYFGSEKPTNCPFCGAHAENLVLANGWKDENDVSLSPGSRKNLEAARLLELRNANFYFEAAKRAKAELVKATFKTLGKIEREHASAITKILKDQSPEALGREEVFDGDEQNMEASNEREKAATALYLKFASEASEPRVKFVFEALSRIESDHIHITAAREI